MLHPPAARICSLSLRIAALLSLPTNGSSSRTAPWTQATKRAAMAKEKRFILRMLLNIPVKSLKAEWLRRCDEARGQLSDCPVLLIYCFLLRRNSVSVTSRPSPCKIRCAKQGKNNRCSTLGFFGKKKSIVDEKFYALLIWWVIILSLLFYSRLAIPILQQSFIEYLLFCWRIKLYLNNLPTSCYCTNTIEAHCLMVEINS